MKTKELKPHPLNATIYGASEVDAGLKESIRKHGIKEPLVVKADGTIISGHRRWQAAMSLEIDNVPCRVETYKNELDEQEALIEFNRQREKTFSQKMAEGEKLVYIEKERAKDRQQTGNNQFRVREMFPEPSKGRARDKVAEKIGIGSGKTFDKAAKVWDAAKQGDEKAKILIEKIDKGEATINKAYTEISKQVKRKEQQTKTEEVERAVAIEKQEQIRVEQGQFWKLGNHVLYCGDTSKEEFIISVPQGAFAFADPPYNAEVDKWDSGFIWDHDWLIDKAKTVIVTPGIVSIFKFAQKTSMPYVWSLACWITNGMTRGAMGFGNWIYGAIFSRESIYCNSQDFLKVTISNAETSETAHRGRKPAGLIVWLIDKFSKPGDIIIDPFLGSGTTLLAAETTGRFCYGGEINPGFCAEIIARWEKQTGQRAEVVVDG